MVSYTLSSIFMELLWSIILSGKMLCDVYQEGVAFVEDKKPELKGNLVKNFR